jgi:hypothetical protein
MNFKAIVLYTVVGMLLMQAGCKKDDTTGPSETPSIVYGGVIDADYNGPIVGASITTIGQIQPYAASDSLGAFSLSYGNLSSQYTSYLIISASGYNDTTMIVTVEVGRSQTILIRLRRVTTGGGGGVVVTNPDAKKAAQVAYIGTSASDIYISGVGALENSVLTYEVRDSLGLPVARSPRYGAAFSINFYPNVHVGGGTAPRVIPSADSTDITGRLHVSIVSGTEAGVVEVFAQIAVDSTKIITSMPVRISVHAGFPDQDHFTLMPSRFVFPSMDAYHEVGFTAAVGDTFSNPVPTGWAVYFHSQAGIMQTGKQDFTAYTDKKGLASVDLETVNPVPYGAPYADMTYPLLGGRIGGEWVYAQTMGRNNKLISDSVLVIWNQAPILVGFEGNPPVSAFPPLDSALTMPAGGSSRWITMVVTDVNGNPLCDGTRITGSVIYPTNVTGLNFGIAGDIPRTIPIAAYCRWLGPSVTDYTFCVVDNSITPFMGTVTLVISVDAPGLATFGRSFTVQVY